MSSLQQKLGAVSIVTEFLIGHRHTILVVAGTTNHGSGGSIKDDALSPSNAANVRAESQFVTHSLKLGTDMRGNARLNGHGHSTIVVNPRHFECLLHVHPELDVVEEKLERPLVLLIAAWSPEYHEWFAIL